MTNSITGFNGEPVDPVSGAYLLGHGVRAYDPVLMRFRCPDSLSPFDAGGVNAYAYCAGDPLNRADPSGHMSWPTRLGLGLGALGMVLGVASVMAAIPTGGGSVAATLCILSGLSGLAADSLGMASMATAASDPALSAGLSWGALAMSVMSLGTGFIAGSASRINNTVALSRQTWGWKNTMNIRVLSPSWHDNDVEAVYYFEDMHRGLPRLSVVGHAQFMREEGTAGIAVAEDIIYMGGDVVTEMERGGYDFSRVTHIRTIMCHSAEGGLPGVNAQGSLAAQVAERTGLPTTGYLGTVTTQGILDDYADDYLRLAMRENASSSFPDNFSRVQTRAGSLINHTYQTHLPTQVREHGPAMFRLVKHGVHYEPRTFLPRPGGGFSVIQRGYP